MITKLERLGAHIAYDENKIAKELVLDDLDITDDDLQDIETLSDLVSVRLSNSKISNATVAHLGHWSKLQQINLRNTLVTDQGLDILRTRTKLTHLSQSNTKITDDGLIDKITPVPGVCKAVNPSGGSGWF